MRLKDLIWVGWFVVGLYATAIPLSAEQPNHADLSRRLFLLRASFASDSPFLAERQGIWSYDPATKTFEPITTFVYRFHFAPEGRVQLAALEDRFVLQGNDYWEFDLASGRLLRRYKGMQSEFHSWALQGALVPLSVAKRLGIEPGTYGYPICPTSSGTSGYGCSAPPIPFPGYPPPMLAGGTRFNLLFHRGILPEQTELRLVQTAPDGSDGWTLFDQRQISLDEGRRGFWYWTVRSRNNAAKQQLAFAPVTGGLIGEEILSREIVWDIQSPPEQKRLSRNFTYFPPLDSFFQVFRYGGGLEDRLVRQSIDLMTGEVIDQWVHGDPLEKPQNDSMAFLPGTLPEEWVQVIPAIGHGPGANGTRWRSDLYLYNPSAEVMRVVLRRVSHVARTYEYVLDANESLEVEDVLKQLGGGPVSEGGDGVVTDALVVTAPYAWGEQLSVYSRTYTFSTSDGEMGGTYGQAVPAVPSHVGYSTESGGSTDTPSSPSVLILDKRDPTRYRHNLGVVNDSDQPLIVRLEYALLTSNPPIDPDIRRSVVVSPHSVRNVNIESLFPAHVLSGRPPRINIATDRPVPIWLSMVDNRSGDATFVPFSLLGIRTDANTRMIIPAIAHTPGANDTFWKTDLYGFFPNVEKDPEPSQQPRAWFYPADGSSCGAVTTRLKGEFGVPNVEWPDYWRNVFPDVVRQFPGCEQNTARGALQLRLASWMSGFSRTYTTRADGGTLGEMLPFFPAGGWPVQHFAGIKVDAKYRINIGLFNGLDRPVANRLELYDAKGVLVAETTIYLSPNQWIQEPVGSLFKKMLSTGIYGLSVIAEDDGDAAGRSWAYVSLVDNVTGDPAIWW